MTTKTFTYDAVVIGSGAAGFNAANTILKDGRKSVALITEGLNFGTSRNTGSDKQTYYKLSLSGNSLDSVKLMAKNIFDGGAVDGDNALCEAALSTRCFLNLCELGVPFPTNRYGEYIGYKTDHDPFERATSAGPLTSKFMTDALQKQAFELDLKIHDKLYAVEIIKDANKVAGLLCLDTRTNKYVLFNTPNVILATGGPAAIYADNVYPKSQHGSTSIAIKAGAYLQNLSEWQYGLASIKPKWNVSGSYMQVLPRLVSVDKDGKEHEFLLDHYKDKYKALSMLFLKGYQWPFDEDKAKNGSSVIDLLVHHETNDLKRKVYLDFKKNPFGLKKINFKKLSKEAYTYLANANALEDTPIKRLTKLNKPAIELYKSKGINLAREYLQIALCSQHLNGGISVDKWWQTNIKGLFAVGECAGTHGINRPGGSALNAGQVGSLRASQYILEDKRKPISASKFKRVSNNYLLKHQNFFKEIKSKTSNVNSKNKSIAKNMSMYAGAVKNFNTMKIILKENLNLIKNFNAELSIKSKSQLLHAYKLQDVALCSSAVLYSMIESGGKKFKTKIMQVKFNNSKFITKWRNVRPIPRDKEIFEKVWKDYRKNKNVY